MANHFLGALKELERRSHDNILIFSDVLAERLNDLCEAMVGEVVSDNDYMKLFELYYQKYRKQEKKKAMMYCILRIQQMASLKKDPKLRRSVHLVEFSPEWDEYTNLFLYKKRPYYKNMQVDFKKKVAWLSLGASILALALLCLVCRFSFFLSLFVSLLIFFGFNFFMVKYGFAYFYEMQLESMQEELDPLCKKMDFYIYNRD